MKGKGIAHARADLHGTSTANQKRGGGNFTGKFAAFRLRSANFLNLTPPKGFITRYGPSPDTVHQPEAAPRRPPRKRAEELEEDWKILSPEVGLRKLEKYTTARSDTEKRPEVGLED